MKNHLSSDHDYNLWALLHQVRDITLKAREKELIQYGISSTEAAVLFVIGAISGRATVGEISRWLFREPHSASSLLTRMEKKGLVSKAKDLDTKDQVNVTITEKGQKAYSQSLKRESIREIMSSLSEEERQQLWSTLEKLRDKALTNLATVTKPLFP